MPLHVLGALRPPDVHTTKWSLLPSLGQKKQRKSPKTSLHTIYQHIYISEGWRLHWENRNPLEPRHSCCSWRNKQALCKQTDSLKCPLPIPCSLILPKGHCCFVETDAMRRSYNRFEGVSAWKYQKRVIPSPKQYVPGGQALHCSPL